MRQLSVIVPKTQLHNLLSYAGQDKSLHLVDVPKNDLPEGVAGYEATTLLTEAASLKNRLAGLTSALGTSIVDAEKIAAPLGSLEELASFLDKETVSVEQAVRQHEDAQGKLVAEQQRLDEISRFLTGLEHVGVTIDTGGTGFATILAGEAPRENLQAVRKSLENVTYGNTIFAETGSGDKTQTFLAVFPAAFMEEARQATTSLGAKLEPSMTDLPSDPAEAKKSVKQKLDELGQSNERLGAEWKSYSVEAAPYVKGLNILTELFEARGKALAGSSATQSTIMLRAWVPADRVQQFTDGAAKSCDGLVSIHDEHQVQKMHVESAGEEAEKSLGATEDHSESKGIPSLVRISSWGGPLQSVINNFGIPSYGETNPLLFMFVSYPIIYGMMFGDLGEGLVFVALGFVLLNMKRKKTKVPDIVQLIVNGAELVILLGIGIAVFGLVFGDFFGFETSSFGLPALFSPTEGALAGHIANLKEFMVIVLLFGVAHITFGLSLSVYNKIHLKEYSEAVFGPICWIIFYLSGVYLVAAFARSNFSFSAITDNPLVLATVVIPVLLMGWKEGGLHAFEAILSSASNTFSYLRIWALNIADFFFKYALFTAGGIPGAIGGNVLVMIIEGLIVFVQTLRLHWVEWFSKFYEGAGLGFAPYVEPTGWIVPA